MKYSLSDNIFSVFELSQNSVPLRSVSLKAEDKLLFNKFLVLSETLFLSTRTCGKEWRETEDKWLWIIYNVSFIAECSKDNLAPLCFKCAGTMIYEMDVGLINTWAGVKCDINVLKREQCRSSSNCPSCFNKHNILRRGISFIAKNLKNRVNR